MAVRVALSLSLVNLTVLAVVSGGVDSGRLKRSDDVVPLQTVVDNLSQQMTQLTARMTAMQNQIDAVKNNVAFFARHTSDPFSVASRGTLIYDNVITNIGNAYDHQTGIFMAPVPGTYVFFINCMAVSGTTEETYIVVDGTSVAGCHSSRPENAPHEQGGTMATVHLQPAQRVWVRLLQDDENVRGAWWNTFSGFLLQQDV